MLGSAIATAAGSPSMETMRVISGHEEQLHVGGHLVGLVLRQRDEAPVVAPGVVEDVQRDLDVALDVLLRERARR